MRPPQPLNYVRLALEVGVLWLNIIDDLDLANNYIDKMISKRIL